MNAWHPFRGAGVYALNFGIRMWTAEDSPIEHSRQGYILIENRRTAYPLMGIHTAHSCADNPCLSPRLRLFTWSWGFREGNTLFIVTYHNSPPFHLSAAARFTAFKICG